jgi:hypothetical protein
MKSTATPTFTYENSHVELVREFTTTAPSEVLSAAAHQARKNCRQGFLSVVLNPATALPDLCVVKGGKQVSIPSFEALVAFAPSTAVAAHFLIDFTGIAYEARLFEKIEAFE